MPLKEEHVKDHHFDVPSL